MRGHVFVVNEETLPVHLKCMFVGTSAGEKDRNISLLSDMYRIKKGDYIFFYIEGTSEKKGRFFGIFKAKDNDVHYIKGDRALEPDLPKKLIYRKLIEPYKVFSNGVLEFVALDKLPRYSNELLWMLIYRKMKGKRGNTMLFPWETKRLINLIKDANDGMFINSSDGFCFDKMNYTITKGQKYKFSHGNIVKLKFNRSDINSETSFQAYIMQNLNVENNNFFPSIFGKNIIWIGNEVFAGVGMQKIDVLTIEKSEDDDCLYRIIELKYINDKNLKELKKAPKQLRYYICWGREDIGGHLLGSKKYNTKPLLFILDKTKKGLTNFPKDVIDEVKKLKKLSLDPEIWVLSFDGNIEKII